MIYSPKKFKERMPVEWCGYDEIKSFDNEYICMAVHKNKRNFPMRNIRAILIDSLPNKAEYIALRMLINKNRNTRDNVLKLQVNKFNIWKIGYYQKNKAVIESLLDISGHAVGLIPEEAITYKMAQSCVLLNTPVVLHIPKRLLNRGLSRYVVMGMCFTHRGDEIKVSDLFESSHLTD